MHCHGVCTRLLTRDKLFQTYMGPEKDLRQDYEEDNQVAASQELSHGGQGKAGGEAPPPLSKPGAPDTPSLEEKGAGAEPACPVLSDPANALFLSQVVVFAGSSLAASSNSRGWWRPAEHWAKRGEAGKPRPRPPHLTRMLTDARYRTRLCQHYELSCVPGAAEGGEGGAEGPPTCAMRRKNKCDFAHGPMELRVKEGRRGRWGREVEAPGAAPSLWLSGGEDVLGLARRAEKGRVGGSGGGGSGGVGGGERRQKVSSVPVGEEGRRDGFSAGRSPVAQRQQQERGRRGGGPDDGPWRRGLPVEGGEGR
jgi:hypothetical protein